MTDNFPPISVFVILLAAVIASPLFAADNRDINVQTKPREIVQGGAIMMRVSSPMSLKSIKGEWRGKILDFDWDSSDGSFSLLLGMDLNEVPGKKNLMLNVTDSRNRVSRMPFTLTVLEKTFPLQRLTLPPGMVSLSPENLARVKRERAILKRMWGAPLKNREWKRTFVMPVQGAVISPFGVKRLINNKPRSPHSGIDLRGKAGTPVIASSDGIVALTVEHFFSGNSVYLDHGMGIFTMYFHLSNILVKEGERVAQGQTIGLVGQTGRATGPHLHWGVRIRGNRVDPLSLVRLFDGE